MFLKTLAPLTISMAVVAGLELAASEDSDFLMTPDDLRNLVEEGMTEQLLEEINSQRKIFIEMTGPNEIIDAVQTLTTGPLPYDIDALKQKINHGRWQSEKHEILKEIL